MTQKPYKVFISHSTADKAFVDALVDLLEFFGIDDKEKLLCSSVEGYQIPLGENFRKHIWEQFDRYRLFVIFVHSGNYYSSPICLNEMGAAWVMKTESVSFLTKGFPYSGMRGVIDGSIIATKVDTAEAKARMNELKDKLVSIFKQEGVNETRWEKKRDEFLEKVNALPADSHQPTDAPVASNTDKDKVFEECYMLVFDRIFQLVDMKLYPKWTYYWAVAGSPRIAKTVLCNLEELSEFLSRLAHHKDFKDFDSLLDSLALLMKDYINLCYQHIVEYEDGTCSVERFYSARLNNPYYDSQLDKYKSYTYLIADMTFEMTRLLNLLLERIREIKPSYLNEHGILVVQGHTRHDVEYRDEEKTSSPYTGLDEFIKTRNTRTFCFDPREVDWREL